MARKFYVCGNLKMNGSKATIDHIIDFLKKGPLDPNVEVVMGFPGIYLDYARSRLPASIGVTAQNCYKEDLTHKGAYTGEVSPDMIKDVGCEWVILGHTERRKVFGESDQLVGEKVGFALQSGLKVLVGIGELLQPGNNLKVVINQLQEIAKNVCNWDNVVIAYQPCVEISTQQAQETISKLRDWMRENVNPEVAEAIRFLTCGNINSANCRHLASCPDIDGLLIGRAALNDGFLNICNANI